MSPSFNVQHLPISLDPHRPNDSQVTHLNSVVIMQWLLPLHIPTDNAKEYTFIFMHWPLPSPIPADTKLPIFILRYS